MIYIFTGPIGSGKTTRLENWIKNKKNGGGILMPVIEGRRFFLSIRSGEEYPAEAGDKETDIIGIGKFRFSVKSFNQANCEILKCFEICDTVVIDEIGPLELNGEAFAPSLSSILNDTERLGKIDLILVVRDGLAELVIENFGIKGCHIVTGLNDIG